MVGDVCKRIRKVTWEAERLNKGQNETPVRKIETNPILERVKGQCPQISGER
jgi:hypothetical protein